MLPMAETVQQLVARVLAAAPADRPAALRELARAGDPATALSALAGGGPRVGLEFLARLPGPLPWAVLRPAVSLLADPVTPLNTRLTVAGKLLETADAARTTAVVQPLVAGLSESDRLTRLLDLRRRVERCDPLDELVQNAEAETVEACPRCRQRFTRPGLAVHLWEQHRLRFADGKVIDTPAAVLAAVAAVAADPTGAATDAAFLLSRQFDPAAEPVLMLQVLARDTPDPSQADRLTERAADEHSGVCPTCLTFVPDPLPPLPPPADVTHGRVSADGFTAAVVDRPTGRVVTLDTPAGPRDAPQATQLPPRQAAALYSLSVFGVGLLVALVLPGRVAHPVIPAGLAVVVGWLAYVVIRSGRELLPEPTDAAVTLAWRELVPGVGRSPAAVRFLIRLCRGSIGFGDPGPRAGRVHELAEQAAVLDRKGEAYSQLAAAAAVLRASDTARIGREPVAGLVDVFRPFARGQASAGFAEAAAEIILADGALPADHRLRLGVGVTASLFDAGLTPADLQVIVRLCPWLRKLLPTNADHLAGLFAVWQLAAGRGVGGPGPATTIFDLAANSPAAARRLLSAHPDTVLRLDLGDTATAAVGAVLLTADGLVVGGLVADDPEERIEAAKSRLLVGDGQLAAEAPVPPDLPDRLREWLIWRTGRLLPKADASRGRRSGLAADRLAALAGDCPLCGLRCAWRAGHVGTFWPALS